MWSLLVWLTLDLYRERPHILCEIFRTESQPAAVEELLEELGGKMFNICSP